MNDIPDFHATALRLMAEAQSLGAEFCADGTWVVNSAQPPLPAALSDRLRAHRRVIATLRAEAARPHG